MAGRYLMLLLVVLMPLVRSDVCPEGAGCDSRNTCCSLRNGTVSCCRLRNAVCCPGGNTCCPAGEACTMESCFEGVRTWPFVGYKGPARRTYPVVGDSGKDPHRVKAKSATSSAQVQVKKETECPDKSLCQLNFTCCPANPSGYGCCPMKQAVCCPDQVHCCPSNTICSSDSDECLQSSPRVSPLLQRRRSITELSEHHFTFTEIDMTVIGYNTSIRIEMFPPSSSSPSFSASSTPSYTYFPSSFLWLTFLIPPSLSSSSPVSSCASYFLSLLLPLLIQIYYDSGAPKPAHA